MIRTMIATSVVVAATALSPAAPAVATTGPSGAGASAAAAAGPSATARTDGNAVQRAGRTDLILSYMAEAGYATAVKLRCDPDGGAHPKPIQACDALTKVGGRPDRLRPARIMCMLIYAPVTAEITGTWKGRRIDWSKTYGNSCEMSRATGVLFRF
jgi:subtilisin inhibitor-like